MLLGTAGTMGGQDTSWDWGGCRPKSWFSTYNPMPTSQKALLATYWGRGDQRGSLGSRFESRFPLPGSMNLLHLSKPQFPHLQSGVNVPL